MSRRGINKRAGDKVLVDIGNRKEQDWVPGVVHSTISEAATELDVVLDGSRMHSRYSAHCIIFNTQINRAKHGLV